MKDPKPYLEEDFAYHADILDALLVKESEIIYSEDDGVMLRMGEWGPYAISAKTEEAMGKMAKLIEEKRYMAVVRPFKFLPKLFEIKGKPVEMMPCYQAAYPKKEPVLEYDVPGIDIKPLTEENLSFVCKNYDDDEDYIKSRINYGMLGAFDENGN